MVKAPGRASSRAPKRKAVPADGLETVVRYTPEVVARVCEAMAKGAKWSRIAGTAGMPSYSSYYLWKRTKPGFAEGLAQARLAAADWFADRALEAVEEATPATASVARLQSTHLMSRAAAMSPDWSGKAERAGKAEPQRLIIEVRRFEKVVGADGEVFLRELRREKKGKRK